MKKLRKQLLLLAALLSLTLTGCEAQDLLSTERADSGSEVTAAYTMTESQITDQAPTAVSVLDVPEFSGEPYVVLNGNEPDFTDEEKTTESYEHYSDLDSLGRCGVAEANIGQDLMPTEKRGAIGQVKPTGWHTVKYDQVEGKYLYNRCHLIGYQLTGENANEKNLITGTRYLNVEGMLPFENMVADYVKETGNHVLYRVTPIFTGDDLVADGVEMEALSMEDDGEGISFHIFAYNNQPGISINYATGDSTLSESSGTMTDQQEYVMNTSSMKFHLPSSSSVSSIKDQNTATYQGPREDLIADGPAFAQTPQYMDLKTQAAKSSMLNTPNTFGIYVCGKVFRWVEQTGGLAAMAERNWAKANLLYDLLEHSELFHGTTQTDSRSIANITFRTNDAELDAAFVAGAAEHQIQNVKGHRLVGGMRASVYNAVTMEDVQALASYMKDFEVQHSLSPRSN